MIRLDVVLLTFCAAMLIGMANVGVLLIEYFTTESGIHPVLGSTLIALMLGGIYAAIKAIRKCGNSH